MSTLSFLNYAVLFFLPPPLLIPTIPSPHPLSCLLLPSSVFTQTLNQSCVQLRVKRDINSAGLSVAGVCARRSTWMFLSSRLCPESLPQVHSEMYCEAQMCEINYREREGEADFQGISRFHAAKFKELFNATCK